MKIKRGRKRDSLSWKTWELKKREGEKESETDRQREE
jgi:hypothetical protein